MFRRMDLGEKIVGGLALVSSAVAVWINMKPPAPAAPAQLGGDQMGAAPPSYRASTPGGPRCSTCRFASNGRRNLARCRRFGFVARQDYVCDDWRARG